jgi:hypothetical protein
MLNNWLKPKWDLIFPKVASRSARSSKNYVYLFFFNHDLSRNSGWETLGYCIKFVWVAPDVNHILLCGLWHTSGGHTLPHPVRDLALEQVSSEYCAPPHTLTLIVVTPLSHTRAASQRAWQPWPSTALSHWGPKWRAWCLTSTGLSHWGPKWGAWCLTSTGLSHWGPKWGAWCLNSFFKPYLNRSRTIQVIVSLPWSVMCPKYGSLLNNLFYPPSLQSPCSYHFR